MYYNINTQERVSELPRSTETISNFNLLSPEELREHGYYPLVGETEETKDWQKLSKPAYEVRETKVVMIRKAQDIDLEEYKARKTNEVNAKTHETIIARFTMEDQQNQSDEAIEILGKIIMQTATPENQVRLMEISENKQWRDGVIAEGRIKKQAITDATTHEEVYNLFPKEELGVGLID